MTIKFDFKQKVEDVRTREELKAAEYNLDCLCAMHEEYIAELEKILDEINDKVVAFIECGPYETGAESLNLAQDIYKLSVREV